MITKWFSISFPFRADLSGRPFGFLFVWHPRGVNAVNGRFAPLAKQIGFHLPWTRFPRGEQFECNQLIDKGPWPNGIAGWPQAWRTSAIAAAQRELDKYPGRKIVYSRSFCDRRIDLAGHPYQLTYAIEIA